MKISTWAKVAPQWVRENLSVPHANAEPQGFRRWSLGLLSALIAVLGALATTVIVIDPLMQYHRPWFGLRWVMWKEDYLNPGLAKNWPHDAVVIGGSFVQNTKVSEINTLFGLDAIKLTNSGGSVPRVSELMQLAVSSPTPVKAVFVSLPMDRYARDVTKAATFDGPQYLYNSSPWDDIGYLLNLDVLVHLGTKVFDFSKTPTESDPVWFDSAYSWYDRYKDRFSKRYVLAHYFPPKPRPLSAFLAGVQQTDLAIDQFLLPSILAHPETTFYFFQPPHSRLLWRDNYVNGNLSAWLGSYQRLCERLLGYPNVRIFNFMMFGDYPDDLNHYKDRSHYHPEANSMMFEAIARGEYEVKTVPSQAELETLLAWARDYQDPDIPVYHDGAKDPGEIDDAAGMADQEVLF